MQIDLLDIIGRAFDRGFAASCQGYNGEYPFGGDPEHMSREITDLRNSAIEEILSDVTTSQPDDHDGWNARKTT